MHNENLKELTVRGIILGALITVIFTASNVYLGLKVGGDICVIHSSGRHFYGSTQIFQRF